MRKLFAILAIATVVTLAVAPPASADHSEGWCNGGFDQTADTEELCDAASGIWNPPDEAEDSYFCLGGFIGGPDVTQEECEARSGHWVVSNGHGVVWPS